MSYSREYWIWIGIRRRTLNPDPKQAKNYRGRGITMYPAWIDDFMAFYNHVGPRPSPKHSIERINNDGNYEPGNVRWATRTEQQRNRRTNVLYTFAGETLCVAEWAERLGYTWVQMDHRLRVLPLSKALTCADVSFTPKHLESYATRRHQKVTPDIVAQIRVLYGRWLNGRELAEMFGY